MVSFTEGMPFQNRRAGKKIGAWEICICFVLS